MRVCDILGVLTPHSSHIPMQSVSQSKPSDISLHPNTLLHTQASFSFSKPYAKSTILTFENTTNTPKTYNGIITQTTYLGTLPNTNNTTKSFADTTSSYALTQETNTSINNSDDIHNTAKFGYKHFFSFTLSSNLIALSYNNAKRIYTNTTILEVIKSLLYSHTSLLNKALDFSFLQAHYPLQEIITQYDESDLAFITRLAHNNGIYFYEDSTTLYVCDTIPSHNISHNTQDSLHDHSLQSHSQSHSSSFASASSHTHNQSVRTLLYNPNATNTLNEECVFELFAYNTLKPKGFSSAYNKEANPLDIAHSYMHTPHNTSPTSLDMTQAFSLINHSYESTLSFTHNPNIKDSLHLKDSYTYMLDSLFSATSNIANLNLAQRVSLQHNTQTTDTSFYIIAIEHTLISKEQATLKQSLLSHTTHKQSHTLTLDSTQHNSQSHSSLPQPLNLDSTQQSLHTNHSYTNTLTLLPSHIAFTPQPKAKPTPPTSTQGIVIGEGYIQAKNLREANQSIIKEANTIHTDSYGRVRVRLHSFYAYALSQEALIQANANEATSSHNPSYQSLDSHTLYAKQSSSNASIIPKTSRSSIHSHTNTTHSQTQDSESKAYTTRQSLSSHTSHSSLDSTTQENQSLPYSFIQSLLTTHTPFLRVIISYMDNIAL